MKAAYPVIFTDVDTNILVEVPDLGILNVSGVLREVLMNALGVTTKAR